MIPLVALAGLCAALLFLWAGRQEQSATASQVARSIREIALRGSGDAATEQGGPVGPWWIAADSGDLLTGEFLNFRLKSGGLHVAARRAMLHIDPDVDTISFELWDVIYAHIPISWRHTPEDEHHYLHEADHYVLGPVPWGENIVADAGSAVERLVQPERNETGDGSLPSPLVDAQDHSDSE